MAGRLAVLNAVVINRWLAYDEVSTVLGQYDCMVLSNIEASQSGVVALAHGFGMPVVATPVGGLTEQIKDRHSGLIARSVSAAALADAMELFVTDGALRWQLSEGVAQAQDEFSMAEFPREDNRAASKLFAIKTARCFGRSIQPCRSTAWDSMISRAWAF